MVEDHSESERGNPLLPHGLLFPTSKQEAVLKTSGPVYLHALWCLSFINSPRNHTVTYHFSDDVQEVYRGNRQICTKYQVQFLQPSQISTSDKSLWCNNSSGSKSSVRFLTCTFRWNCYSTRLSWAHYSSY